MIPSSWTAVKNDLIKRTRLDAARIQAVHGSSWTVYAALTGHSSGPLTTAQLTGTSWTDNRTAATALGTITAYIFQEQPARGRRQEGLVGSAVDVWKVIMEAPAGAPLLIAKGHRLVSVTDGVAFAVGVVETRYGLVYGEVDRA